MSTKTLRKRIALVAVSALTAGVLSVASAPVANAATGDSTFVSANGLIGTTLPTLSSSAGTAEIVVGGSITITVDAAASDRPYATVSGGKFTSVSGGLLNAAGTTATANADNVALTNLTAVASTAGVNMVIKTYGDIADAAASVNDTWTVTVRAPGLSGAYSSAYSLISIIDNDQSAAAAADTAYASIVNNGGTGVISYTMKDGLDDNLPSTTVVYASIASGGCVIGLATAPTSGRIVVGTAPSDLLYVAQSAAFEDTPTTCVVDIEVAGTKVTSKTFTFQGAVAGITVTSLGRGKTSTNNTGQGYIVATDSAGNQIAGVAITGAVVNAADASVVSSVTMSNSGNTTTDASSINGGTSPAAVPATIGWNCTAVKGTVPIQFSTPNGSGGTIKSAVLQAACASDPTNYTASLDKASYVPGDIATLTITAKDSAGQLTNNAATLGTDTTYELAITGSNLVPVSAPTNSHTFTNGVKTYKFTVGSTGGSYNMVVDLPKWNSTTYSQSAITIPYQIKTSGTTNEDILKSIVSLIASINKQIQALQKLILKR